ncbi:MAG: nucleoside monophosphate kinase [Patescibacteria group bacterium]|jgi:adenylate kinase family enzyme
MNFPIYNNKALPFGKKFDLNDTAGRKEYFDYKLGGKIEEIKAYLDTNTFVGFLVAKKSAGKGTYSKMFQEVIGVDRVATVSVGDVVRDTHKAIEENPKELEELEKYMEKNYRGFISVEDSIAALLNRNQGTLLPTEFILILVKREIEKNQGKAIFVDGLPRSMDQISYSLYFRELINFRDDPDFFVLIDVPESVIDERMKYRVVCPICHTSRNTKLLPTKFVEHDLEGFHLLCDNDSCSGYGKQRLEAKEGDSAGIQSIRERLDTDGKLMEMATGLYGIPKILLRNSIPEDVSDENYEDFELTPEFSYKVGKDAKVETTESPWTIKDDAGVKSYSLMAPTVMVSFFDQVHKILLG